MFKFEVLELLLACQAARAAAAAARVCKNSPTMHSPCSCTLALAVAIVNGLWVTMGDGQVREAVKKDSSDLFAFFRETNEIQRSKGYFQLEDYPLEAKICLAYTSSIGTYDGLQPL